jgi:hypothetical protein
MVDKLNPAGRIALAAQLSRVLQSDKRVARNNARGPADQPQAALSVPQRLAHQIAAIDPDDPRRGHKAFRAFIELRMLDEFGENLRNDAAFQQLVDDVVNTMQADAALRADIDEVMKHLLSQQG